LNESFDRVLNELDFLKNKVQNLEKKVENLEEQNLILENKIENLEKNSMLAANYLELKEDIEKLETRTDDQIECITLNTEANTQRLDDVQEVNYSFKYYASSPTLVAGTRVEYGHNEYGSGVDSTGLFTAPIGGVYQFDFELKLYSSNYYYVTFWIRKNEKEYGKLV